MRALLLLAALSAAPAFAERPADILARQRGIPSTNAGALGSAFPQQYVSAYRCVPRPVFVPYAPPTVVYVPVATSPTASVSVGVDAGSVHLGGTWTSGVAGVACPAPGFPTTLTTTTVTTTTTTTFGHALPAPPPPRTTSHVRRVLAEAPQP